jgi:hypothetical protein
MTTAENTSQAYSPVPAPIGCGAHRQCSPVSFCDTSGYCPSCANCRVNVSFNGICPSKCADAMVAAGAAPTATAAPTAPMPPTNAATQAPTTADVASPMDMCNSHNHDSNECAPDLYCATPMPGEGNVCKACSECVVAGDSFNGNCPNKCITGAPVPPTMAPPPTIESVCVAHRECNDSSYCTENRQCEPCDDCNDGATWNGKVCPDKCTTVLGPEGQQVGSKVNGSASAEKFSAALAVGLTLCVVVVVLGTAAFVVTTRQQRTARAVSTAETKTTTLATSNTCFDCATGVDVDDTHNPTVDLV